MRLHLDPAEWEELGKVDPEFKQMVENGVSRRYPNVQITQLHAVREAWLKGSTEDMHETLKACENEVDFDEIYIPVRDGTDSRTLVFTPKKKPASGGLPLIVLIHGGGFLFGAAEMEASVCINATKTYGCITMSLSYRLSPEATFPVAYNDCWDVLRWITQNAANFGADLSKGFVLGGTSSGGQIASALSLLARDEKLSSPLTGVYLNVTSICQPEVIPDKFKDLWRSRDSNNGKAGLSQKTQSVFYDAVRPDIASALWSPLLWPSGHSDLPPTYFQVCGADIQRDDSLIYERVLRLEGIETKVDIYPGLPHVFWYLYPSLSTCSKFYKDALEGLGWLLEKSKK